MASVKDICRKYLMHESLFWPCPTMYGIFTYTFTIDISHSCRLNIPFPWDPILWVYIIPPARRKNTHHCFPHTWQSQTQGGCVFCNVCLPLFSHGLVETMFGWSQQKTWEKQKSNKKYDLYRSLFLGGRFVSISFHWFDRCGFSTHSFSRGPGEPLHRGRWRRNIDWYLWLGTALWSAWGLKRRTLLKRFTEKWMQVSFLRMFVYVYIYIYIDVYAVYVVTISIVTILLLSWLSSWLLAISSAILVLLLCLNFTFCLFISALIPVKCFTIPTKFQIEVKSQRFPQDILSSPLLTNNWVGGGFKHICSSSWANYTPNDGLKRESP